MILYHVSTNLLHNGVFEPRIPSKKREEEDATTPRICVASSIEGCLTALPGGGVNLDGLCWENRFYFLVFRIDTEKLGIPQDNIITCQYLFENDLVRDAEITGECWITAPFVVPKEDTFVIQVKGWDEEIFDLIPYKIYKLADEKYDGDYIAAYVDFYNEPVPCQTAIKNLEYITENVKKGDIIQIFRDEEGELDQELLLNFLKNNSIPVEIISIDDFEITFRMKEDTNLKCFFVYHYRIFYFI